MTFIRRFVLPPAMTAAAVVIFELARTLLVGGTELGGLTQIAGFTAALAGLLGLPLFLLGYLGLIVGALGLRGWAWGRGELPSMEPARRIGWVLFGGVALVAMVLIVQQSSIYFVKAFKKPVYQGLASGLVAAGTLVALTLTSGPIVGVISRGLERLRRHLPAWLDPGRAMGLLIWSTVIAVSAALLAPVFFKELHTVDLRGPRLALAWLLSLALAVQVLPRWRRPRVGGAVALVLLLTFSGALVWSATGLGRSQIRLLAVSRHTLLAGKVASVCRRVADGDGDGVPRLFGGGDCDDANAHIRPGVYDPPDDGIDQNCTGDDLTLVDDPLRPPARSRPDPEARESWNVLLITIDAVRHDVMRSHMPGISAFADEAINYRNAYANSATTYWSLAALATSRMPSRIHFGSDQTPVNQERMLAEVFRDARYMTALYANVTVFFVRGLRQGCRETNYDTSHFTVHGAKPGSAHMTDAVLGRLHTWRDKRPPDKRKPFFVWAHYYDPHDPYFEVPGYPADNSSDRARYDAIVRYTDAEVTRLIDALKKESFWQDTVVIITGDHGEEFLDHGHRFHGKTTYEEVTHVPLVLRVPGIEPRILDTPIGHTEVAPTLLDLMGVEIPKPFSGRSRADEIRSGKPAPVEPVWLEVLPDRNYAGHQVALRLGDLKLIYRIDEHYFELYDLAADPRERRNVYDTHPDAPVLMKRLLTYVDHHLHAVGQGRTGADLPPGSPGKVKRKKTKRKSKPKSKPPRATRGKRDGSVKTAVKPP